MASTLGVILLRSESGPRQILAFNPPDCILPCMVGISPGETDFSSAFGALASQSVKQGEHVQGAWFELNPTNSNSVYAAIRQTDPRLGHYVSQIYLYTLYPDKLTTLGEMLNAGYLPVRVFRHRVKGPRSVSLLVVIGEDQRIAAEVSDTVALNADSPVSALIVFSKEDREWRLGDILNSQHWDYEIDWLGFAPIEAYLNQVPKDLQSFSRAAYQM
jgi:hypothetical protein